jgi:hypothetical protein
MQAISGKLNGTGTAVAERFILMEIAVIHLSMGCRGQPRHFA